LPSPASSSATRNPIPTFQMGVRYDAGTGTHASGQLSTFG
jgi:hypothetical protein